MARNRKTNVTMAAAIVMISTVFSRMTGYLREILIAHVLGVNYIGDAYKLAFLIPDLMFSLLLGGAIAAAIIPVLTGYVERDEEKEGWKSMSTFFNTIILAMVVVSIFGALFTPQLLSLLAQDFNAKPMETQLLAIQLTRILFSSVGFLMLAGLCNGVLNAYHRFTAAAFGPVIYNVGGIISLLFLGESTPEGAKKVALGFMASSFLYFVIQLSVSIRNLKFYRPVLYFKNEGFIRTLHLAIPSLISSSVVQVNQIITARFTFTESGNLTLFDSANKTWQLPLGIFAQSMAIAILPTLSAKIATGDVKSYRKVLTKGVKMVLFIAIPSAIAFVVLNENIMRALFKWPFSEQFTEADASASGNVLMFFSVALVAQSIVTLLTRAFYANNDSKTPLYVGSITIVTNFVLGYTFYHYTAMGISGMALAYSVSSAIYALLLIVLLQKKTKGFDMKDLQVFFIKALFAAGIMGIVLYSVDQFMPVYVDNKIMQLVFLAIEVGIGAAIYLGVVIIMGGPEGKRAIESIRSKARTRRPKQ